MKTDASFKLVVLIIIAGVLVALFDRTPPTAQSAMTAVIGTHAAGTTE
jgi:hypothetical protein